MSSMDWIFFLTELKKRVRLPLATESPPSSFTDWPSRSSMASTVGHLARRLGLRLASISP